jgi:sarcosine oxidase gamma subunit
VGPASTESQKPQAEAQAALRDAMESAVEISDMRVNVLLTGDTTEEKNGAPVKTQMFSINLEPGDFVVNTAEKNLVDLTFSAAALDARHAVISSSTKQVHAKLTAKTLEGLSTGGLSVRDKMEAPPQTRELRFAVRDNQSGKVGSVVIMLARASAKK